MSDKSFMSLCNYEYTTLGQLKIYNRTNRNSFSLPDTERIILMFILDRTVGWRKVWEKISPSEFVSGVKRRRGQRIIVIVNGTHVTPDQLNEALIGLEERGAIEILHIRGKTFYKISDEWSPSELEGSGMWELGEGDYDYYEEAGDTVPSSVTVWPIESH